MLVVEEEFINALFLRKTIRDPLFKRGKRNAERALDLDDWSNHRLSKEVNIRRWFVVDRASVTCYTKAVLASPVGFYAETLRKSAQITRSKIIRREEPETVMQHWVWWKHIRWKYWTASNASVLTDVRPDIVEKHALKIQLPNMKIAWNS